MDAKRETNRETKRDTTRETKMDTKTIADLNVSFVFLFNVCFGPSWASVRFDVQICGPKSEWAEKRDEMGNEGMRKGKPKRKRKGRQNDTKRNDKETKRYAKRDTNTITI